MKLYAQHGFGAADKVARGLTEGLIDGVIISPRDVAPDVIGGKIAEFRASREDAEIMFDPQLYACFAASSEAARLGKLTEWPYFGAYRRSDLELASEVQAILRRTFEQTLPLPTTVVVAPGISVSRSFDSREGVIAKSFIRQAREAYDSFGDERPLFATLAVSREALLERGEFEEFLNDITVLRSPPDGFYILVGSRGMEARTDIFHADVIARWMLLNHSLAINGFQVVNGYSDLLTPLLGAVGGTGGASGWWSNLRVFSLDRYAPWGGIARQPIPRYVSVALLNRITFTEKEALAGLVPTAVNRLPHDRDYSPEPDRAAEALQSWEALRHVNETLLTDDISSSLEACDAAISRAEATYSEISQVGITLDRKSSADHVEPMKEALGVFKGMAGLE